MKDFLKFSIKESIILILVCVSLILNILIILIPDKEDQD
jgi:hypothetical protein